MAPLDNFTIDLTNYKEKFGTRVPEGTYRVRVDDAELDTSKAGNQMINMWYVVQGGEHDGATLTDRLVLSDKAMFRVVAFMHAVGMSTKKQKHQLSLRHLIGKVLEVTVEDGEPYNGNVRSEVRAYARPAVAVSTAQASDDLEDLPEEEETTATTSETATETAPASESTSAPAEEKPREISVTSSQSEDVDLDELDDM